VICTSAAERDEIEPLIRPEDRAKLSVVYNAIPPPRSLDQTTRASARAELGVGDDMVLGLFVGQLEPRKAPLVAARAAVRTRAADARFTLAMAGDGPEAAALEAYAGDAVKILGYRPDLDRLLSAADVFVAPAEREGMSLALLAAMGRGLAVVASDGPGNPEAVGDAALLFGVGDEAALVRALTELAADPALRESLGARARSRAEEQFGAERFLAATEDLYRRALSRSRALDPAGGAARA
jgi:glycosyltransferase involved in cell wall biosynthesis